MAEKHCLETIKRRAGGRFVDVDNVLLSLFNQPGRGGERRWPEVFGQATEPKPSIADRTFLALALRKSVARSGDDED